METCIFQSDITGCVSSVWESLSLLFSPAGEARHYCDLRTVELLCNSGKSEICSDDVVIYACVSFFPPTEQLPYLGGFYHQGRQIAVAAQVRACLCAHISVFLLRKETFSQSFHLVPPVIPQVCLDLPIAH